MVVRPKFVVLFIFVRLGITLGSKLWYDFSSEISWDEKMIGLVKGCYYLALLILIAF